MRTTATKCIEHVPVGYCAALTHSILKSFTNLTPVPWVQVTRTQRESEVVLFWKARLRPVNWFTMNSIRKKNYRGQCWASIWRKVQFTPTKPWINCSLLHSSIIINSVMFTVWAVQAHVLSTRRGAGNFTNNTTLVIGPSFAKTFAITLGPSIHRWKFEHTDLLFWQYSIVQYIV